MPKTLIIAEKPSVAADLARALAKAPGMKAFTKEKDWYESETHVISSAVGHLLELGMPMVNGISKPAGVRCVQLDADDRCQLFGRPERPAVCASLMPSAEMCGDNREQAMRWLGWLERETGPT